MLRKHVTAFAGGPSPEQKGPAERHIKGEKQAPDSTPPRINTSPRRRGLLAAIFPSSQLHCPFPKELWILRAAGHARELCNLVLGSRRAL